MSDSENPETTSPPREHQPELPQERAGEILRRERVAKRIAIETIARDLKLNVRFIKAIEAMDYKSLPGEPYIRVYLRSIARYLMLDPDDILKRHFQEQGITLTESRDTKISIIMEKNDKPKVPWVVIVLLVGILLVIGFIGNRMNSGSQNAPETQSSVAVDTTLNNALDTTLDSAQVERFRPDSSVIPPTGAPGAVPPAVSVITPSPATSVTTKPDSSAAQKRDTITLRIEAVKDSVWIQAYQDGKSWRMTMHPGTARKLIALDSLNVRVGRNSLIKYTLNGKLLDNKSLESTRGADIVAFKIDHTGITPWTTPKWISVFKQ